MTRKSSKNKTRIAFVPETHQGTQFPLWKPIETSRTTDAISTPITTTASVRFEFPCCSGAVAYLYRESVGDSRRERFDGIGCPKCGMSYSIEISRRSTRKRRSRG